MSLWCVASLAALAFGFAMLYPCIVMGCATGVFRALRYVLFVSTQHEYSLAYAVSLVNTSPWICAAGLHQCSAGLCLAMALPISCCAVVACGRLFVFG